MMTPRFKKLSREDYQSAPSWLEPLFITLNEALSGLVDCLSGNLTRTENFLAAEKIDMTFATLNPASGTFPLRIKNTLPVRPKHVVVTRLVQEDGGALASAWSSSWRLNQNNEIELTFQGLAVSTGYVINVAFE